MRSPRALTAVAALIIIVPALAQAQDEPPKPAPPVESKQADRHPALLDPTLATDTAPAKFRVRVETTAGDFVIEVVRGWAPNGADRFYNLVKIGYYSDAAFFRVIENFMAQVGFHADPRVTGAWRLATLPPDPVAKSNTRGMVTFAMAGTPDTRTTQIFINHRDNTYLDEMGFAPIGKVVEGMDVVLSLYSGYGDGAPNGNGPGQMRIAREGNEYLRRDFPKLDYINRVVLLD